MGTITITTKGSFGVSRREFSADKYGHAHAAAEAITYLADALLPKAINDDHEAHDAGDTPKKGFKR